MKQRKRICYTEAQKSLMWDRWQKGESLRTIAQLFDRSHSSVRKIFCSSGGIRPPKRKRSALSLTLCEREIVSRGIATHSSIRAIAAELSRSPSTISREINRNGGYYNYRATHAEQAAWDRGLRPKRCKLASDKKLSQLVAKKLKTQWSPQQIAGWLKREHPDEKDYHVSHETIYKTLYIQARGALKKELIKCLQTKRIIRRPKNSTYKKQGRGGIANAVSISERPPCVEDRAVPGHWEGDLIAGCDNTYIATLVERHSRYVMLAKVKNKDTESVINALIKQAKKLPTELYKSLTWDRGSELADHKRFTLETNIDVYFCDPQSPWQRGSNENTNRLLRQYFPKGTNLAVHSQVALNKVACRLNERPRKTLEYETPAQRFSACVAATG